MQIYPGFGAKIHTIFQSSITFDPCIVKIYMTTQIRAEKIQFSNELLMNYHQSTMLFSSIVVVKWKKWGNLHNRKLWKN